MKNKLKLEDLKVKSFVTNLDKESAKKLAGGAIAGPQTLVLCSDLCSAHNSICNATRTSC